MFVQPLTLTIR